jgi:DNA gyrase subunit B
VGVTVVNFLSEWLEAEVYRDGKIYKQKYQRGKATGPLKTAGSTEETGTKITFKPDEEIFTEKAFSFDTLSNRLRELAFLNPAPASRLSMSAMTKNIPSITRADCLLR